MQNRDFIPWLLEARTPSIRYLTLRTLPGKAELDAEVQAARKAMKKHGTIPEILARQTRIGSWAHELNFLATMGMLQAASIKTFF